MKSSGFFIFWKPFLSISKSITVIGVGILTKRCYKIMDKLLDRLQLVRISVYRKNSLESSRVLPIVCYALILETRPLMFWQQSSNDFLNNSLLTWFCENRLGPRPNCVVVDIPTCDIISKLQSVMKIKTHQFLLLKTISST